MLRVLQNLASRAARAVGRDSWIVRRTRPRYEYVLDWATSGRGVPWPINGSPFRIDPRDRHRYPQSYEPETATFIRERLRPGSVCIDVGANVGVYVLQLARWTGPRGRVVAFEPNPAARAVLERHVRLNDFEDRVSVVPTAVGDISKTERFYASDSSGMSRFGAPSPLFDRPYATLEVPILTLDAYCAERALEPDWLLIDTEGYELAVLLGARELVRRRGKQLEILVEMHPTAWIDPAMRPLPPEQVFAELGRVAVPLTGQRNPLAEYGLIRLAVEAA